MRGPLFECFESEAIGFAWKDSSGSIHPGTLVCGDSADARCRAEAKRHATQYLDGGAVVPVRMEVGGE